MRPNVAMKEVFSVLNQMVQDQIISGYALGGAVAAIYYAEPFDTQDVDVFVSFKQEGPLISLSPIYDYLLAKGYTVKGEAVVIQGWPVQFLPTHSDLTENALANAVTARLDEVEVRIFTAEFLVAIMIDTGRPKDHLRACMFIEQGLVDVSKLGAIFDKYSLRDKWKHVCQANPQIQGKIP